MRENGMRNYLKDDRRSIIFDGLRGCDYGVKTSEEHNLMIYEKLMALQQSKKEGCAQKYV